MTGLRAFVGMCLFFLTIYGSRGDAVIDTTESVDINDPYGKTDKTYSEVGDFGRKRFLDVGHTDDFRSLERRKRSYVKYLAIIGAAAVKYLLSGAKHVKTKRARELVYAKRGNFGTALKDFNHVVSKDSIDAIGANEVMYGTAGNKHFTLRAYNGYFKGKTTIAISDVDGYKNYVYIVYVKPKKDL